MTRTTVFVLVAIALVAAAPGAERSAQLPVINSAEQVFEITSIKPSASLETGGSIRLFGGALAAPNVTMQSLINIAYEVRNVQLIDVPDWVRTERFAVTARAAGDPPMPVMRVMLQNLLRDRIGLVTHRETRPLPGYVLEILRSDRLGPGLRRRPVSCRNPLAVTITPSVPLLPCGFKAEIRGTLVGGGFLMSTLAEILTDAAGGIVDDQTGLIGEYDVELEWAAELAPTTAGDSLPSLFAAVQDQLGLRLRQERVPTPVLVIDKAERPKPD